MLRHAAPSVSPSVPERHVGDGCSGEVVRGLTSQQSGAPQRISRKQQPWRRRRSGSRPAPQNSPAPVRCAGSRLRQARRQNCASRSFELFLRRECCLANKGLEICNALQPIVRQRCDEGSRRIIQQGRVKTEGSSRHRLLYGPTSTAARPSSAWLWVRAAGSRFGG